MIFYIRTKKSTVQDNLDPKDILLADDDEDDALIFKLALDQLDLTYELRRAENGELLFVMLKEKMPYILFLDINMPCKDGFACIHELRKNKDYDSLPIIMYTSHLSQKYVEDCFRGGANFYLSKTEHFNELVAKLKKVFSFDWREYLHYPPSTQFLLN